MTERKRVVITGIGVVAPNGVRIGDFWSSLVQGISAVDKIRTFEVEDLDVQIAAEISSFEPSEFIPKELLRKMDRFAQLGFAAAKIACDDAAITNHTNHRNDDRDRVGVCIGSGLGGILFHEVQIERLIREGPSRVMASSIPRISPNSVASYIAIGFGFKGPNLAISTACSSGAHAIGTARDLIRLEKADVVVAGGVEAPVTPTTFSAYSALGVLSKKNEDPKRACRPFDRDRDGFVLAEGAGVLVLEDYEHAKKRGAEIYAEVVGFASNCGAYHMVTPEPNGDDAASAMQAALQDASLEPKDIDYINAHGTGTIANDIAETKAIKKVFGPYANKIPISSIKGVTGHTIGAAGAIECIASVLAIVRGVIPQTTNYKSSDPECDLDYVPISRGQETRIVMSNSFGFGSNNAVIILKSLS